VKANAAKFGVELDQNTALWACMELEQKQADEAKAQAGDVHAPAVEAMRSVYKDQDPNQTATWFRDVKQSFDRDPVGAVMWAAQEYGLSPQQLAQQIYLRAGAQQNQPTQQDVNRLYGIVEQAYAANPRIAELEQDVLDELASPNVLAIPRPISAVQCRRRNRRIENAPLATAWAGVCPQLLIG
jgi:hypothetical protein